MRNRAHPGQLTPLDTRTDGTYSIAGTAERSANSCVTSWAAKVVRRNVSPSAARRVVVTGAGAPARRSMSSASASGVNNRYSLRSSGESNDWKKKRSPRKPGANASEAAFDSSVSHSTQSPTARSGAEIASLPAISSGSRVVPSFLCVRSMRISPPDGTVTSPQRSMPSLVSTATMLWVRISSAPSLNTPCTVRSRIITAGAAYRRPEARILADHLLAVDAQLVERQRQPDRARGPAHVGEIRPAHHCGGQRAPRGGQVPGRDVGVGQPHAQLRVRRIVGHQPAELGTRPREVPLGEQHAREIGA